MSTARDQSAPGAGALIRQARADEVEAVRGSYEWLFEAPGARPVSWDTSRADAAISKAIRSDHAQVLVAEAGGKLVGLCTAYLDLDSVRYGLRCWVEDLAVDPQRRSSGIGGALLDAAEKWARERGATHLELDTGLARTEAQRFYERRGPVAKGFSYSWTL